ncbi:type II secretion system F family protein [Sulfitobacter sp. HNIBRBA2951]|uniref:type II secretion system F family protein n=1 Tax=Sulfitobacter aquimarinus TaxID=3158557 RepID=UPI0032DFD76B
MILGLMFFGAGLLVLAALLLCLIISADRQRRSHRARLARLRPDAGMAKTATPDKKNRERHSLFVHIEAQLRRTNLRLSLTELLVQLSLGMLFVYAISVLAFGLHPVLALPIAIATPLLLAAFVVHIAQNSYRAAFTADLPEALDVFARGLRAGRPVSDSLGIVVETSKGPTQREFSRCHDEICMGETLVTSLSRLQARVGTPEVSFFSVATSLQAETGGNMIETMENLAHQLRERRKLRKKAHALSSEARASALILASLPFAVALAIAVLNADYLAPLYADHRGRIMAGAAIGSIGLGMFIMRRMGKLDV